MELPPRSPFDQGLFLTHFNKGREAFEAKRFDEAERELEEAYLLRPRDQKVLNLLGLAYFRQERFDKAEEVYRKLLAESPEVATLHYNLGLICFKLERLEEAESAFLKAIAAAGENPKIRFYLGSIYERQRRFQDAIYQYRQAGAHILVRRIEDKLAHAPEPPVEAPPAPRASPPAPAVPARPATPMADVLAGASTLPPGLTAAAAARPSVPAAPSDARRESDTGPVAPLEAGPPPTPKPAPHVVGGARVDTARVRADEVEAALLLSDQTLPGRARVQPVGKPLMAEDAPPTATQQPSDTARFRRNEVEARAVAAAAALDAGPARRDLFRVLDNALVEVNVDDRVFIRPGTLYSYSGAFTFWVKERRPGGHPALAIATGRGRLLLRDQDREVIFLRVEQQAVHVEPERLLACEASLVPRFESVAGGTRQADFLVLEGHGLAALSVARKPLALDVSPELPVSVPAASVVTWEGALEASLVDDAQLYETAGAQAGSGAWLRLTGRGRLLAEPDERG
jgi:Flp pilus assembly protein TadD